MSGRALSRNGREIRPIRVGSSVWTDGAVGCVDDDVSGGLVAGALLASFAAKKRKKKKKLICDVFDKKRVGEGG